MKPLVIGGIGGSGTRLICELLADKAIRFGETAKKSKDNLAFTFLLKRPNWYRNATEKQIAARFKILEKCIKNQSLSFQEWILIIKLILRFNRKDAHIIGNKDAIAFLESYTAKTKQDGSLGWAWKEPNTHFYLPHLINQFPKIKYVHVLRDSFDMVLSKNQNQFNNWRQDFNIDRNEPLIIQKLEFWMKANEQTLRTMSKYKDQCCLVSYDRLLRQPSSEVQRLFSFLGISPKKVDYSLIKKPAKPKRGKELEKQLLDHTIHDRITSFNLWIEQEFLDQKLRTK